MDFTINTVASSEMIPTSTVAANPGALVATKSSIEVIAHLEKRIGELNLLVTQYQAASQNLPPDARQKGPMPPSASLTHSTLDTPFVYIFAPPKAPMVTHHAPPVYTYVTTPPVTKAQEFHRQDVNHYIAIENDARSIDVEMMNRKMKSLEDAMRGLHGFDSSQRSGNPFFHLKIYCEKLIGVGNNKGIRIKLFNQSLTRRALEWYPKQDVTKWCTWDDLANAFVVHYKFHAEIAPNRISITKLKPKSTECFREYAIH
ncbi:hypothetical protein R3W88_019232 [Solanum pinnatisectum]|uniref:Retrotransposon gag domain-containing protein n=1 Tax=Solanum pinnatisectum TaxID=50273 RepID=A0AAV9KL49_9SOLN|nr:hypothetical protein R3W88_019232 [Solanum pinnatisectum]